ncbi:GHKL domain-containing protein [Thiorhodococcus mannitoliphagus]|uniref:histidine kinase n=1 Tax=Thiorhodococcus mannitoliphagus TaxID=329406 RepID=A0A6P1DZD6_9GAMM|nr:GHKL domain-containing protein [Thiorhodococcus mannitoliphagus]
MLRAKHRSIVRLWVACWLLFAPAVPAEENRCVLVLYSNNRLLPANIEFETGLRETLDNSTELNAEFLDYPRFEGESYLRALTTFLHEKYALRPPAVLIAGGKGALDFVLRHRAELFPGVPVIHAAVSRSFLRSRPPLPADVVGVPIEFDFPGTIELALRLHPRARRLVLVTGASKQDRAWEAELRGDVAQFQDRVTTEFLAGLPTDTLLQRLSGLDGDTLVVTPGYFEDGVGHLFSPREAAGLIAAAAAAPVYGPFDTFIGIGIVGGSMPNFAAMGQQAGRLVKDRLAGGAPAAPRLPEMMPKAVNLDWRQIRRWDIDPSAIPDGAIVRFKPPTLLEQHATATVFATVVFLLQAGLIARLLFESRRRRRMELAIQQQRFELAHASRLAVAGELTGAIAHEINQPLGAILSNADAADLLLASDEDRRDELRAIMADIRRDNMRASEVIRRLRALLAKQPADWHTFALNDAVRELEPVLRAEARRRGVALDLRLAATATTLLGDRVQIQQVLINLALNAMDAANGLPEARRAVALSVERDADRLTLVVRDRGQGIAPEHLPRLFDSFFSTKPRGMGLGLSITRTLVEAHGGRVWAESDPGAGAVFRVEWPAVDDAGTAEPA